jgi:transposase-like protein
MPEAQGECAFCPDADMGVATPGAASLRSARTTNYVERLHEEFKRRIKTQTLLPSADTAAMLFWALLASGQINMRKVDGWHTLTAKLIDRPIDLAA